MNQDLIDRISGLNWNEFTPPNTIRNFLNYDISGAEYGSIPGKNINDKMLFVHEYLCEKYPTVKEKLNIVFADDVMCSSYVNFLNLKYDVTVVKTTDIKDVKDVDLVLFTGGEDVNPMYYNQKVGKFTGYNDHRDQKEIATFNRFQYITPMLGICRGSQLLTVLNGGKLIQHVSGHGRDHTIVVNNTVKYNMTSTHHQMMYPFDLPKENYNLIGHSEYFKSGTYLNGDDEEVSLHSDFLEPEIVFYNNTNSLCIQGHPEYGHCEKRTTLMCLNLIDKYLVKPFKDKLSKTDQLVEQLHPIYGNYDNDAYDYGEEEAEF